jgi:hypothetical protein
MKMILGAALFALTLSACAESSPKAYYRVDGQPITTNPALMREWDRDDAICRGEMAKADSASVAPMSRRFQADEDVYRGCMAQRGYVQRPGG